MGIKNFFLYVNTIRYLKIKQIYYRLFYLIRDKTFKRNYFKKDSPKCASLFWNNRYAHQNTYFDNDTFVFLNQKKHFQNGINWNFDEYGKLWCYNLNYFEFLNQEEISREEGLRLIADYVNQCSSLQDGLEPYPISLRGINWIKFLSTHNLRESSINEILNNHYRILFDNIEYHLMGNHLLENGFSLFFGAYYFKNNSFYRKAKKILINELSEQITEDGAHFELSPMYHQILLFRLLDCIHLAQLNPWKSDGLLPFMEDMAIKMLSWLQAITFSNGSIPMVNDCAYGIAPSSRNLFDYAIDLDLVWNKIKLSDSGYRRFHKNGFEIFMDVGKVGPDYQPGHAHSDTFNFELYLDGNPVIVDTGTSTYEKNELRQLERGTAAHNTVKVGNKEQTEVWGGFRVAKRAKIIALEEGENLLTASHNGYGRIVHQRQFDFSGEQLLITDTVKNYAGECHAFLHFHPSIENVEQIQNRVILRGPSIEILFEGTEILAKSVRCEIAMGFNKRESSIKLLIGFKERLTTNIRRIRK